jgi:glycosyltransferase involved in cell wall biosynthesis
VSNDRILISVVICTYNRANILQGALESLLQQILDKSLYEIIVVDNASTDGTRKVVQEFISNFKDYNIKYIYEPRQGLSNARNAGYENSLSEYVAYIDDDARAMPDWLSNIQSFISLYPEVKVFGGPYNAFSITPVPSWFPPEYGKHNLGTVIRKVEIGSEWIHGSNIVFKKSILERFKGFQNNLGMSGNKIGYGEETRLLLDISSSNIDIYYVPDMMVEHLIAPYKISLIWLLKSNYANGKSSRLFFCSKKSFLVHVLCILKSVAEAAVVFSLHSDIPLKRRLYYSFRNLFWQLGTMTDFIEKNLMRKEN